MASGRMLLRLSDSLHKRIQQQALAVGISANELCCQRLEVPSVLEKLPKETAVGIQIATEIAGKSLVGVAIFGSWAKGTQRDQSDLDLLIVLDGRKPLTRKIYSNWQEQADMLETCEPHFVNLPTEKDHVSSLWAEVAIDGIILFDPHQQLRQYLGQVRRCLVEGNMVAKKTHGQNYWVRKEIA